MSRSGRRHHREVIIPIEKSCARYLAVAGDTSRYCPQQLGTPFEHVQNAARLDDVKILEGDTEEAIASFRFSTLGADHNRTYHS